MTEKFIANMAEALEIEVSEINLEDTFRDYNSYDSLTELSVFAMLDSEYGIEIEMKEYIKYQTVNELLQLIVQESIQ